MLLYFLLIVSGLAKIKSHFATVSAVILMSILVLSSITCGETPPLLPLTLFKGLDSAVSEDILKGKSVPSDTARSLSTLL